jgi:hypothetical protein
MNEDLKKAGNFYARTPFSNLQKLFDSSFEELKISVEQRQLLDLIWATRSSYEPFKYAIYRNCRPFFCELFGRRELEILDEKWELYEEKKLTDMDDFKNFCDAEKGENHE